MQPLKVELLQPAPPDPARPLARGLGAFIFATSLLLVLFAGTFPFDFTFKSDLATAFDWRLTQYDPHFLDRGQNVLFFMPFSFGLAAIIRPRRRRLQLRLIIVPLASLALTILVETCQRYVSFRDPSLMDIWANTLGGVLGTILYVLAGDRLLAWLARRLIRLKPFARPAVVGSLAGAYALLHLGAILSIHKPGDLSGWDPSYPLIAGNELTGDRPWHGAIQRIALADRAISSDEASRLFFGEEPSTVFGDSLVGSYQLSGAGPYADSSNQMSRLIWTGKPFALPRSQPMIDAEHWLKSESSIEPSNRRIMKSAQVTFLCTVMTDSLDQRGPARLAGISSNTLQRNLQLGQEFGDLSVRMRMAARNTPELFLPNVFLPNVPRQIIVTEKNAEVVVYVDGHEQGRMLITPEAKVIWRFYPRGFGIRLKEYGFRAYAAIYRALVFIPFSALLGLALLLTNLPTRSRVLLAIAYELAMIGTLETILGKQAGAFQPTNLLISLLLAFGTLGVLVAWRHIKTLD